MDTGFQEHVAFHLSGRRTGTGLAAVDDINMLPALLAGYRDLTQLRYDFPLVLVDGCPAGPSCVQSLSAVFDGLIQQIAGDDEHDRQIRHLLKLEQSIRAAVAAGATGSLSSLWDEAARLLAEQGDDHLVDSLERGRTALKVDGTLVDCGQETPAHVLQHMWATVQQAKAERARADLDRLILKLSDILRVDVANSDAGRSPDSLKAAIGAAQAELFDFEAMSRLIRNSSPAAGLPDGRRRRIEHLVEVLKTQRFFGTAPGIAAVNGGEQRHSFIFPDCTSALAAYRERMPEAIELARATAIAELEIDSQYDDARHDALFAELGAAGLDAWEKARFPDYLVLFDAARLHGAERDALTEILSAGLPVKVLVQTDDILDESRVAGEAHLAISTRSRELASAAIGFNDVYVLQASGSHLYQFRERIFSGLTSAGPAVFSVFSGATGNAGGLSPYLVAAAAMESRAFPAFTYDPAAGDTWADRFHLESNPQFDLDWPAQHLAYEDEQHQRVETSIDFTLVDFVACDHRFARHFALVPRADWNGDIIPVAESLRRDATGMPDQVPCIFMVDEGNLLQKVIVENALIGATRQCRDTWHSLQELGGIHNSHAERLLARERKEWEAQERQAVPVTVPLTASAGDSASAPAPQAVDVEASIEEPAPSSDDAYIESARCTTCNECIQINNKMFAYDENKQCHIVDLNAGTYRDLVEAAENCQVAIIHPGKPRNSNEPGLEELITRAEAFR